MRNLRLSIIAAAMQIVNPIDSIVLFAEVKQVNSRNIEMQIWMIVGVLSGNSRWLNKKGRQITVIKGLISPILA